MDIAGEIRYWVGAKDYAQLKFSERSASISLDVIHVPAAHRKKGIGALLIGRLIVLGDGLGKELTVSVRPIGAHNEERLQQLVRYYEKFGFHVTDRGLTMVNMARKARRMMPSGALLPESCAGCGRQDAPISAADSGDTAC